MCLCLLAHEENSTRRTVQEELSIGVRSALYFVRTYSKEKLVIS
jgi:hypothetical protein